MIYLLDKSPPRCAECYADKDLAKALREAEQVVVNASALAGIAIEGRNVSEGNKGVVEWVARSRSNWRWFREFAYHLSWEYRERKNKIHKSHRFIMDNYNRIPINVPEIGLTGVPYADVDIPKSLSAVESHRVRYVMDSNPKGGSYTGRALPEWVKTWREKVKDLEPKSETKKEQT